MDPSNCPFVNLPEGSHSFPNMAGQGYVTHYCAPANMDLTLDNYGTVVVNRRGTTIFDASIRCGATPVGASGTFAHRDGSPGHSTQYYSDGYRVSWDTDNNGESKGHWTNQSVAKGSTSRHYPPNDARRFQ